MSKKLNYLEPLHSIKQVLEEDLSDQAAAAYAVVVGPLFDHTKDSTLVWKAFTPTAELTYQKLNSAGVVTDAVNAVDQEFSKVTLKNCRATLWTGKAGDVYTLKPNGRVVIFDTPFLDTTSAAVAGAFDLGRAPQPGDIIVVDDGVNDPVTRKVVKQVGVDIDATIGSYEKYGAVTNATVDVTTVSSSVTFTTAFAYAAIEAAEASAWFRNYGSFGSHTGLRALFEIECLTPGADADAATFALRVNGLTVDGTVAMNVDDVVASFELPNFVLATPALSLTAEYTGAWTAGDLVQLYVDFTADAFANLDTSFFATPDLSDYNLGNGIKKIESQILYTVKSVAENGDVVVRVESTNSLFVPQQLTLVDASDVTVNLAYDGGTLEFTLDGTVRALAYTGLKVAATITPPLSSTTVFDKLELDASTGLSGAVTLSGYYPYTGLLSEMNDVGENYTVDEDAITLTDPSINVPGYPLETWKPLVTAIGEASAIWRQIVPATGGELWLSVRSTDELLELLGSDHPYSEVGYAALLALSGGGGKEVKVLRTAGKTVEDFEEALRRIESQRSAYALAFITEDLAVMQAGVAHINAMSTDTIKHFRRGYVGTDTPEVYEIVSTRSDNSAYLANVVAGDNGNNLVIASSEDLTFDDVSVGDFLLLVAQNVKYEIVNVTTTTLELATGPVAPLANVAIKVIGADTPANIVKYVAARTELLGNTQEEDRRIANIWNDAGETIIDGAWWTQKMRFVAAEAAGARAALPPHQGLSRRAVLSIRRSPNMYSKFRREHLNDLGAYGVWVVTQDSPESTVYIRHQLTTATTGGLLFYEDSVGSNLDLICFEIDDIIDPKIGVVNANNRSLVNIKAEVVDLIARLATETDDADGKRLGPRVERFFDLDGNPDTITLVINPNLRDQFDHGVVLELPTPLNRVRSIVVGRTISDGSGSTVSTLTTSIQA